MARPKKYKEETKIVGFRVPLSEVDSFKDKVNKMRDGVNIIEINVNKTIKGLINFLNEIKTTSFASESKYKRFAEILKRYMSMDDLINLEMIVNEPV